MMKRAFLKKMTAGAAVGVLAFSLIVSAVPVSAAKKKKAKEVDLNGTYHAALGIQTATDLWIMRMAYYDKSQNDFYDTENADRMFCENKETHDMDMQPGTFTDVEIKGNGTYTVSLDSAEFSGEQIISQLHVATDIPTNDTIKFSNVSATVNGRTVAEFEEGYMENEEPYLQGGMVCLIFNHWRAELVKTLSEKGFPEDSSNGYTLLQGNGEESVSVTFTVSGFAYDNPDAQGVSGEAGAETGDASPAAGADADDGSDTSVGSIAGPAALILIAVVALLILAMIFLKKKKSS